MSSIDTALERRFVGAKIDDPVAINVIGTKHQRIDPAREPMADFFYRGNDFELQIEGRHALRIEPSTPDRGPIAGNRLEGPARIMGAEADPAKSHAKPPSAT